MSVVNEIVKEISTMTNEELMERVLDIRKARRTPTGGRNKKTPARASANVKSKLKKLMAGMSQEELNELEKSLKGGEE